MSIVSLVKIGQVEQNTNKQKTIECKKSIKYKVTGFYRDHYEI